MLAHNRCDRGGVTAKIHSPKHRLWGWLWCSLSWDHKARETLEVKKGRAQLLHVLLELFRRHKARVLGGHLDEGY
jgi:hypothetical protein